MSGELEILEWRDALSGDGRTELNSHYVVEPELVQQVDWPKRRQFIMDMLDRDLGLHVIDALKRGWKAVSFERWTWSDDEAIWRPKPPDPSASRFLSAVSDWLDRPSIETLPPAIPDWLRIEVYGLGPVRQAGYWHVRTRITVERT